MKNLIKILHLEEAGASMVLVREVLEQIGTPFDLQVATSEKEFISALSSFKPDIILSDHSVSDLKAEEALQHLQEEGLNIPFIVVTHPVSEGYAVQMMKAGAGDYLLKTNLRGLPRSICQLTKEDSYQMSRAYSDLVESHQDALVILSPEGKILDASEKILQDFEYSKEEVTHRNYIELCHSDDVDKVEFKLIEALRKPAIPIEGFNVRIRKSDKSWKWVTGNLINLLHDPSVKGIAINVRDVSAEMAAQQLLEENEEKYRSFFENSLDGILITAPDGRIYAANPAACKIFQRSEAELREVGRAGIVDASDPELAKGLEQRQATGKAKVELQMLRKDGSKFPAELSSSVFRDAGGNFRTSIIVRDISERKKLQQDLVQSKESYERLFRLSPLPNMIYDQHTLEIKDVNEAAIHHYGYQRDEFLGMTIKDIRPEEEIVRLFENLNQTEKENGVVRHGKYIHRKKDRSLITVEVYGYRLAFRGAECRLAVCIDVTEKEEVLRKLKDKRAKLITAQKIAKLGYWEQDLNNQKLYWTEEVFNIWGRDITSFKPDLTSFIETIHPEDREIFSLELEKSVKGLKNLDVEHRILLPDGTIKWVHEKGELIHESSGKKVFEGTVQDISEQKSALEQLRVSEGRHRAILKSQTNYLIRTDLEGNYTYCNDKFVQDFSWIFPDNDAIGKCAFATVKEYDLERVGKAFQQCIANPNKILQIEIDKIQNNASAKTTLWDFICLTDSQGQPMEVQCVGVDITDRVKAERSLRESNERYELVSTATTDVIYDWDCRSGKIQWSDVYYELFGYTRNDSVPDNINSWKQFVHPEDRPIIEDLFKAIEGSSHKWEAEYRFKKANGDYAFVVEKGIIIRDDKDHPVRMVGTIRDVTEKKKLEELIEQASKLARIGSFEIDLQKNTLFWSPVTKLIHEVPADYNPILDEAINFYKKGLSRDLVNGSFRRAIEKNLPYDYEVEIITAKGNKRWVRKIGRPQFVDGKCVRISGSFQDITELKLSELEAKKASREKEVILQSIGDAFFAVDHDWTVTYWNKHAEELLECSREEILGKNLWDEFSDALDTLFYKNYHKVKREQTVQHFEEYLERVGRWFDVSAYPSPTGLSVYFRDITERRKAEDELLELNRSLKDHTEELVVANKGLEQFSYIVSHNLRSPVANILGISNLLENKEYPEGAEEMLFGEVFSNVRRLDTIIKDLNNILQIRADLSPQKEWVFLTDLVGSIEQDLVKVIVDQDVQIQCDFSEVPQVHSVMSYLRSILYNLIVNSIKYRRPEVSPVIRIKSSKIPDKVVFSIQDNGLGIDIEKKGDQIFGLYKRFHNHVEGKGMGLFMVKTQVELLGGKISVMSQLNAGTEFTIEFPEEFAN